METFPELAQIDIDGQTYQLRDEKAATDIEELKVAIQKSGGIDIVIPITGWVPDQDTSGDYALQLDIPIEGVKESLKPEVTILPSCLEVAAKCGLCSTCRTLDGILRLYAKSAPTEEIQATLTLRPPAGLASGAGVGYRIGHGLKVENGTLSVDTVDDFQGDTALPMTAGGVEAIVGNIEALLGTI